MDRLQEEEIIVVDDENGQKGNGDAEIERILNEDNGQEAVIVLNL